MTISGYSISQLPPGDALSGDLFFVSQPLVEGMPRQGYSSEALSYGRFSEQLFRDLSVGFGFGGMAYEESSDYSPSQHTHPGYNTFAVEPSPGEAPDGTVIATFIVDGMKTRISASRRFAYKAPPPVIGELKFKAVPSLKKPGRINLQSPSFDGWVYPDGRTYYVKNGQFKAAKALFGQNPASNQLDVPDLRGFIEAYPGVMPQPYYRPADMKAPRHAHTMRVSGSPQATGVSLSVGTNASAGDYGMMHMGEKGNGWGPKSYTGVVALGAKSAQIAGNIGMSEHSAEKESHPPYNALPAMIYIGTNEDDGSAPPADGTAVYRQDGTSAAFSVRALSRSVLESAGRTANISAVEIGCDVQELCSGVFQDLATLRSAVMRPECAVYPPFVPDRCFRGCSALSGFSLQTPRVGQQAFEGCSSMRSAAFGRGLEFIGTSAFAGCRSLTSFDKLDSQDSSNTVDMVGDAAFAGTGLVSASLALRSSSIYTFWGDDCFAGCPDLERVRFLSSCYMSTGMFRGCSSLTSVEFVNDHTSYVYPYTFQDCVSLPRITLPSKIWYMSEGMFKGCSNLTSVGFTQYGDGSVMNLVQRNAFDGCRRLTFVEFPSSLDSVGQLQDACLSNCMQEYEGRLLPRARRPQITFHGMNPDDVVTFDDYAETVRFGQIVQLNQAHRLVSYADFMKAVGEVSAGTFDPSDQKWADMIEHAYKYYDAEIYRKANNKQGVIDAYTALTNALAKQRKPVPVCLVFNQKYIDNIIGCWNGETHHTAFDIMPGLERMAGEYNVIFVVVNDYLALDMYEEMEPQRASMSQAELTAARHLLQIARRKWHKAGQTSKDLAVYLWKLLEDSNRESAASGISAWFGDGDYAHAVVKPGPAGYFFRNNLSDSYTLSARLSDMPVFKGHVRKPGDPVVAYTGTHWCDEVLSSGMFRLCADCDLVFRREGHPAVSATYVYGDFWQHVEPYEEPRKYESDAYTTTGFRTGTWYYNARELVQWADAQRKPCLVIYSLLGCKPCQVYEQNIWNNPKLQEWSQRQNFYMCGMEVQKQPYYDAELAYCTDELIVQAENFNPVDSGRELSDVPANAFGEKFYQFYPGGDPANGINSNLTTPVIAFRHDGKTWLYTYHQIDRWIKEVGVAGVLQCLKSLCLYHFDGNRLDGAVYTVNAGREFNRNEYKYNEDNPYRISPDGEIYKDRPKLPVVIDLNRWTELDKYGHTADGALRAMEAVLSAAPTSSGQYPKYIAGCLFSEFDWLTFSIRPFRMTALESAGTIGEINRYINETMLRAKIGDATYKLEVFGPAQQAQPPCSARNVNMFQYRWVETGMPDSYSEDTESDLQ